MADITAKHVVITTCSGEHIEGYVYAYNKQASMLVIRVKGSTVDLRPEFRILHTSFIKDCQSPDQETLKIKAPSYVDVEERKAGLDRAVSQAQKILVSDRPGVPDIAIRVYADLAKTMNPKWGPNDTIILQNVEISAPYDETSCRSLSAQVPKPTVQAIRDRVRNTNEAYKASVAAK
eukprot:m.54791 g.54791  ORF g.54791 m.54791 type:complete len:177 (-) comp12896_c0_seq2:123-653(-)